MRRIFLLSAFLTVVFFGSCSLDNQKCYHYEQAPVVATNTPDSGRVDQTIPIDVSFTVHNSCGAYNFTQETKDSTTLKIVVIASYDGCVCGEAMRTLHTTYDFKSDTAGTFYLKFAQSENEYLVDTLVIH
ncbi:MAG: hypothetical protein JXR71_12855 [Bacteroidales bacterium]|nr:hypothetical protein [Bacteroidales bacterium]